MEDISKITPHEDTPLKLTKQLYTKVNTAKGPELKPMNGALKPGDELTVRLCSAPIAIRPPQGPTRQRHRADQRPQPVQIPRWDWLL